MIEIFLQKEDVWDKTGSDGDVVITTRARLARNLPNLVFPHKLFKERISSIKSLIKQFLSNLPSSYNVVAINIQNLKEIERRFLFERGLITHEAESAPHAMAIIDKNEKFVILINEEDHFRIFLMRPAFSIRTCLEEIYQIDNQFNQYVPYAYMPKYGYLTTRPSNAGSGLKISLLMYLPILSMHRRLSDIQNSLNCKNVTLIGFKGDATESIGSLYLLSNTHSVGLTSSDIEDITQNSANYLIREERIMREEYYFKNKTKIDDIVWRSWAILNYARNISYSEALQHLNNIRLGILFGIIKNIEIQKINELMRNIQWAHLQLIHEQIFRSMDEANECRANFLRNHLNRYIQIE